MFHLLSGNPNYLKGYHLYFQSVIRKLFTAHSSVQYPGARCKWCNIVAHVVMHVYRDASKDGVHGQYHGGESKPEMSSVIHEGFPGADNPCQVKLGVIKVEEKPDEECGEVSEAVANVSERLGTSIWDR